MFTQGSYTEALRVSTSNSTSAIDLDGIYSGIIVTATLAGAVTLFMINESAITDGVAVPVTKEVLLPAGTAPGIYPLTVGKVQCAATADAQKLVAFR